MIDSLPDISRRFLLLATVALSVWATPLHAFQDAEDEADPAEEAAEAQEETQVAEKKKADKQKAIAARSLYFLGARPELKRQLGPGIGKPASILPQPFVPKGSIKVPAAPQTLVADNTVEGAGAEALDTDHQVDGVQGEPTIEINPTIGFQSQQAAETGGAIVSQDAAIDTNSDTLMPEEGILEAGALKRLDPSGVAVGSVDTTYAAALWQGYDRSGVMVRLGQFAETAGSPSLAHIANMIALSGTVFEGDASDEEILAFIEARLGLLMQLGNTAGYRGLLDALPNSYDWTALSRHYTNAYLLEGKIGDACILANELRANDDDAYWLRMVAFCEAARGNRAGVDFQLGILEEISDIHPTFYQLIDQILVEAEQPPGAVLPASATLPASLRIDVLEATMARLARVNVPELALEGVNPLAIGLMLSLPGVSDEAKTELMGMAVRRGWANGTLLAAFARSLKSDSAKEEAALLLETQDGRFDVDATLVQMAARPADTNTRAAAIKNVWERALENTYAAVAGEGLLALTGDMAPNAASGGVLARAALVSGESEAAKRWFLALRSQPAGANADVDAALVSIAPLLIVASVSDGPMLTPALLERWWLAERLRTDRYERANMLFTVLEALGNKVGDEAWGWLEDGPVAFGGTVPAPAQWRRFLIAAHEGDAPKALAFAFRLMSEGGTAAVPASLAGSLVGALNGMHMEEEARMIAVEILISQGL